MIKKRLHDLVMTILWGKNKTPFPLWGRHGPKLPALPLASHASHLDPSQDYYGQGLAFLGRGDHAQALQAFENSAVLYPDHGETYYCIGLCSYHLQRYPQAHVALQRCLEHNPAHVDSLNVIGCIYHVTGEHDKAIEYYRKVLAIKPDYMLVLGNVGCLLGDSKRYNEAISAYEDALKAYPDNIGFLMELVQWRKRLCKWDNLEEFEERLKKRIMKHGECATPFNIGTYFALAAVQLQNAKSWSKKHYPDYAPYNPHTPLPADTRQDGKLRIGYLSGDFNDHATAYLVCELFEKADKNRFDIIAYSSGPNDNSPAGMRMRSSFSMVREVMNLSNQEAAHLIRSDQIDIMVDLAGYSNRNRMDILALRPAPVQIEYLGYPSTTGAPFIDYYIADKVTVPEGQDHRFSEKLIRLPHCYQINDRKRTLLVQKEARSSYGLPDDAFVFCAFNGEVKNTARMFNIWMRLLEAVPGSILWFFSPTPETQANIIKEAEKRKIDPKRIIFALALPYAQHMPRYTAADLFLDTFPINGHTTASDALWAGLPVVTLAGEAFCSRVAASVLQAVNLPELVTKTHEAYEALALALARDPMRLAKLRAHLEAGRYEFPLFDSTKTVSEIETAYEYAALLHRQGIAPKAFNVDDALRATLLEAKKKG